MAPLRTHRVSTGSTHDMALSGTELLSRGDAGIAEEGEAEKCTFWHSAPSALPREISHRAPARDRLSAIAHTCFSEIWRGSFPRRRLTAERRPGMRHSILALLVALKPLSFQAEARRVNVGDAVISYEITGSGAPLVLIHGWAQDLTIWDDQVREFSRQFRVLRYDRRGYGHSTGHADESADPDDLRILLDSLGIRTAYILGLSAGSDAALNFSVTFPNRVSAVILYG